MEFSKWGLNPNVFTVAGVVITTFGATAFMMGYIRPAGFLILSGGFCDTLDGSLARVSGKVSRFGALLDSAVDRYAELIMYLGIGVYFIGRQDYGLGLGTFLAMCGSLMVSYTRARAESLGFEARKGFMQRPERILLLGLGALIHIRVFEATIWLVAVLANFTALQRIWFAYKQDRTGLKDDVGLRPERKAEELRN